MRAVVAAAVLAMGLVALPSSAAACSCYGPTGPPPVLFEGRAAVPVERGDFRETWAFDVSRVVRGSVPDRPVAVVATGDDASCGLGVPVVAGATYEVGAVRDEARDLLFVNSCGGSMRQLRAAPLGRAVPIDGIPEADGSPTGWGWLFVAVLAVAGAAGGGFLVWRGRATGAP